MHEASEECMQLFGKLILSIHAAEPIATEDILALYNVQILLFADNIMMVTESKDDIQRNWDE